MSEEATKPSKGSWYAGVQYDDEFSCPILDESGREVAEAKGENEDECAAHARLIAAGPEMYDALVHAHSMARLEGCQGVARFMSETLARIDEAIQHGS